MPDPVLDPQSRRLPLRRPLLPAIDRRAVTDFARGGLFGLTSDVVGLPGDIASMLPLTRGGRQIGRNPLDSDSIAGLLGLPPSGSIAETAGRVATGILTPDPASMIKGLDIVGGLLAVGRRPRKLDNVTGLPLNEDGTVTVFHHTSPEMAKQIRKSGILKSAAEPDVFITTSGDDIGFGSEVVKIDIDPKLLVLDDQFPSGRRDFRIPVGKPGGSLKIRIRE